MGTNDLIKFPGGTQDKGINNFEPAIDSEISWTEDTQNVSGGMRRGVGVRYGMAPLPGQNNTETPTTNQTNGIRRSIGLTGNGLIGRNKIFAVVPVTMAPYDGAYPKANLQYYAYLVGLDQITSTSLDACLGATFVSSVNKQASTLAAGLAQSSYMGESPLVRLHKTEMLNLPQTGTPTAANVAAILTQVDPKNWAPWAHISVSGKRIPYCWMFAKTTSTPATATTPALNLWSKQVSVGTNQTLLGGSPSEIITRQFADNNQRLISIYCMDDDGYPIDMRYTKKIVQSDTASVPAYGSGNNYASQTGAARTGASTAYSSVAAALLNDPGSYTNTRHDAVLIAGETPFAVVYQDWLQAVKGMMPRWVDLTNPACNPRTGVSLVAPNADIPPLGNTSTAVPFSNAIFIADESGVLLPNVAYDVGFSYYNKLLDYETNVVYATSDLHTGVDTNACFEISTSDESGNSLWQTMLLDSNNTEAMPWEFSNSSAYSAQTTIGRGMHANDYEIRFYYRESGTGEWLPAGSFDAAQLWYYPYGVYGQKALICQAPVAGTVGGQLNGFNDYSPLPKQRYICTVNFQQRAFWWSEKSMHFSYENNIYAYPTRNIVTAPAGKWRGGLVHNRTNLAMQSSRLLVFGDNTYVARFTGERYLQNVRVSFETVGQFEVDGSDFRLDYLSESTAFSYRTAVVADGIAYWWGPQGVYRDDGITEPKKISLTLEPNVFDYYDPTQCADFHCVFNKRTHEIVWFYFPKVADATYQTYALVYNIENGNFYQYKIQARVDASQNIKIENDSTPTGVTGERVLLHMRTTTASTTQQTYFFDDIVKAGDCLPLTTLEVISFSSITTTDTNDSRRLVLAAAAPTTSISGLVSVGDYISIQNAKGYAPSLTAAPDIIAKVVGVNAVTPSIDILLPPASPSTPKTLVTWDGSATLNAQTAFPIWHKTPTGAGISGITWKFQTNYWLPDGMSSAFQWEYLYFLYRYYGIPTPLNPFPDDPGGLLKSAVSNMTLAYRTLVSGAAVSDLLTVANNSTGNCQIHHPLQNVDRSANGQAMAYSMAGIYIGDPWTLEYMEAHVLREDGFTLKEFQG